VTLTLPIASCARLALPALLLWAPVHAQAGGVAIRDVTVVDVNDGSLRPGQTVLVEATHTMIRMPMLLFLALGLQAPSAGPPTASSTTRPSASVAIWSSSTRVVTGFPGRRGATSSTVPGR
jgi:hypothetical protein